MAAVTLLALGNDAPDVAGERRRGRDGERHGDERDGPDDERGDERASAASDGRRGGGDGGDQRVGRRSAWRGGRGEDDVIATSSQLQIDNRYILSEQTPNRAPVDWKMGHLIGRGDDNAMLSIRADNLYVTGFANRTGHWHVYPKFADQIPEPKTLLTFGDDYHSLLGDGSSQNLPKINLGLHATLNAIETLSNYQPSSDNTAIKIALTTLIVTLPEAVRFRPIRYRLLDGWFTGTRLTSHLAKEVVSWRDMSCAVLIFDKYGRWWASAEAGILQGKFQIRSKFDTLQYLDVTLHSTMIYYPLNKKTLTFGFAKSRIQRPPTPSPRSSFSRPHRRQGRPQLLLRHLNPQRHGTDGTARVARRRGGRDPGRERSSSMSGGRLDTSVANNPTGDRTSHAPRSASPQPQAAADDWLARLPILRAAPPSDNYPSCLRPPVRRLIRSSSTTSAVPSTSTRYTEGEDDMIGFTGFYNVDIFFSHDPNSLPRGYEKHKNKLGKEPHIMTSKSLQIKSAATILKRNEDSMASIPPTNQLIKSKTPEFGGSKPALSATKLPANPLSLKYSKSSSSPLLPRLHLPPLHGSGSGASGGGSGQRFGWWRRRRRWRRQALREVVKAAAVLGAPEVVKAAVTAATRRTDPPPWPRKGRAA
uniref:rRNA N-glycosylase n=1 Tax=Oryza nivara TaxID=4536 RepID=A0A0E0GRS8_ORYNI